METLTVWSEQKEDIIPKSALKFLKMKRRLLRLKKLNQKLKARYPKWEQIESSMNTMLIAQRVGKPLPWSLKKGTWATYTKEQELASGLTELQAKITEHETLLASLRSDEQKLHAVRIELATKQTGKAGLETTIAKLEKQIADLNASEESADANELVILQEQITTSQSELKVLIEEKSYYDAASTLLKDTGIKTKIIKQYLPVINKLVNKYLASLDFFVNFNLDESFKETIKSRIVMTLVTTTSQKVRSNELIWH
jgi:hypothetical protein